MAGRGLCVQVLCPDATVGKGPVILAAPSEHNSQRPVTMQVAMITRRAAQDTARPSGGKSGHPRLEPSAATWKGDGRVRA